MTQKMAYIEVNAADLPEVKAHIESLTTQLASSTSKMQDLTDTLRALVDAITGTSDIEIQKRIFDAVGAKPSDYCRELRSILKHLADLGQKRSWPSLETINRAYRLIGEPEVADTEPW